MSSNPAPICVSEVIFRVLRGRWAPKLLATLAAQEPIHFLALGRALPGISRKVLAEQLKFLLAAGVVAQARAEDRQEVIYELTTRGRELKRAVDGLNDVAARWPTL